MTSYRIMYGCTAGRRTLYSPGYYVVIEGHVLKDQHRDVRYFQTQELAERAAKEHIAANPRLPVAGSFWSAGR